MFHSQIRNTLLRITVRLRQVDALQRFAFRPETVKQTMLPSEDLVPLLSLLELCAPPAPRVPGDWTASYQKTRTEENVI